MTKEPNKHSINSKDETDKSESKAYKTALALAVITILYNMIEGLVSVYFGFEDETLSLFGFGLDSFVEVISGIGIFSMVMRINKQSRTNPKEPITRDVFERQALKLTGAAFYILSSGLFITGIYSLYKGKSPESTFWGIVIALISITIMWAIIYFKIKIGRQLNSDAILADAACSRVCMYLSLTLLLASAGYEYTNISGFDALGAIVISWLCFKEGREAFDKAQNKSSCSCSCSCQT
ncbi:cation efflux protein [Candidatus Magnetoovum chiemensis]|nr:cation efflux protein [Candidatus Magnetoovum chiemensis]